MFSTDLKILPKVLTTYTTRFHGLGMGSAYLAHLLILRADPETGMVNNVSYRSLAKMMAIEHAPGRRNAGIPKITRIRSYMLSIQLALPDDFEIISEGQQLKLCFKTLPACLADFMAYKKENREGVSYKKPSYPSEKTYKNNTSDSLKNTAFSGQVDTDNTGNNSVNKKKQKLTNTTELCDFSSKHPIADDFTPSAETIATAEALGYTKVNDSAEIAAFIAYNQKYQSQWEDFNPVYLRWLKRGVEHEQRQAARLARQSEKQTQKTSRSTSHVRSPSYDALLGAAHERYLAACTETVDAGDEDDWDAEIAHIVDRFTQSRQKHPLALESDASPLRQSVCPQTWGGAYGSLDYGITGHAARCP